MSGDERDVFEQNYDITGKIGELFSGRDHPPEWAMYSYSRPGRILWNAIAARLASNGWTAGQIGEWLRSKSPRHALDGKLGDHLTALGKEYAEDVVNGQG